LAVAQVRIEDCSSRGYTRVERVNSFAAVCGAHPCGRVDSVSLFDWVSAWRRVAGV